MTAGAAGARAARRGLLGGARRLGRARRPLRLQAEGGEDLEIGLGLRPDLTGRGLGAAFLAAGLDFARERFAPDRFTLAVATFNERAITVYKRAGFARGRVYMHWTNGAEWEFLEMSSPA